jgi:hypothetical protein
MANIVSYLSEGFLQEFIDTFPRDFFSDDFLPNTELYHFLDKHTEVILGGKEEDYSELVKTDGLTRNLIDRYFQGDDSVKFENWNIENFSCSSKCFKFGFLASKFSFLNSELNKLGYTTYQIKNHKNLKKVIGYEAIPVTNNTDILNRLQSWESLNEKLLPFNSILIVDNYLFTSPTQAISTIRMTQSLLSGFKGKIFLTFIYSSEKYHDNSTNQNLVHRWQDIKFLIENAQFESLVEVSVIKMHRQSTFHDRTIITNSQLIVSGNSFSNFFDSENTIIIKSPTILNVNSHACTFNKNEWHKIAEMMLRECKVNCVIFF